MTAQQRLYMPDTIVAGLPNTLHWSDAPLNHQEWHVFPFPQPLGQPPLSDSLVCKELEAALVRTEGGVTQTAMQIKNMPSQDRLRRIRRCVTLFQNLAAYGSPDGAGVATVAHGAPANHTIHTCRPVGHRLELPSRWQQAKVLDKLFPWFVVHDRRTPAAMTSEPSVQDEVHAQIIEPLNMLLETRYVSSAGQATHNLFYPQWGRSCPRAHRNPGSNTNAGFPDFLLYIGSERNQNTAIIEVKTWWAYPNSDLTSIFSTQVAARGSGAFTWGANETPSTLLKQLWGELYFFGADWGACTNGQKIFIFIKTDRNELTLSEFHDFHDNPLVHKALLGMCFASIDQRGGARYITESLCPLQNRESLW
ncbi:hypothetical protein JB92DRAFT_3147077 [Gautieria morchelliformis]|nr:hypothetical protein JB92DRAFT_3147077 [Gautieria morchelliformis]